MDPPSRLEGHLGVGIQLGHEPTGRMLLDVAVFGVPIRAYRHRDRKSVPGGEGETGWVSKTRMLNTVVVYNLEAISWDLFGARMVVATPREFSERHEPTAAPSARLVRSGSIDFLEFLHMIVMAPWQMGGFCISLGKHFK